MFCFPKRIALMLFASLLLIGCGGGGGSTTGVGGGTSFTGKFIDATVAGIAYRCGSSATTTGLTTATGEYTCPTGQSVAFYVGDILIGSVSTAMAVVTPLDLVGANASPTNTTVMNIVRFLMSISSTDPNTGTITIDPAVATAALGKTANFSLSTTALDTLITTIKPGATVVTNAQATAHITSSINGLFAGSYSGTFAGSGSGNWSVSINANGIVSGTSDAGVVSGSMATTLTTGSTYGFSGSAGGVPWTGTLNISTKIFNGTWNDGAGSTGTFTGTAAVAAPVSVPTITSFTPASGALGAAVSITGTGLAAVTQVLFTGPSPSTAFVAGVISTKTATSVATAVPGTLAAGSYTVSVVYPGGEAAPLTALTVTAGSGTGTGTGIGAGLTITPDFNGMASFADRAPTATSAEAGQTSLLWNEGYPTLRRIALTHDAATKAGNTTGGELIFVQVVNFSAAISLNTGVYGALQCAQGATSGSSPTCASVGIAFDKAAGTVTFTNMPLTDAVLSSGATTARTMSGSLTFAPF